MSPAIDMIGYKRGRATVIAREGTDKHRFATWRCVCACGNEFVMRGSSLRTNKEPSCGCAHKEVIAKIGFRNATHGETGTRLHNIWSAMRSRCRYPKNNRYQYYGGAGIDVIDEWYNSYETFRDWALENGYEDSLSIDRIDNDDWYYPENCQWSDATTQNRNRSNSITIEYKGEETTIIDLSKKLGIKESTIKYRHRNGLKLDTPLYKTIKEESE